MINVQPLLLIKPNHKFYQKKLNKLWLRKYFKEYLEQLLLNKRLNSKLFKRMLFQNIHKQFKQSNLHYKYLQMNISKVLQENQSKEYLQLHQ